ncbi:MAG: hypothetical protein AB7O65_04835 [Candidatus Korobacteraceae bacterium]
MTINRVLKSTATQQSATWFVHGVAVLLMVLFLASAPSYAADFPEATISNGQITAKMYLPDTNKGYYRSTRFDWSGAVYSLQYKGHEFYGPWYDSIDPKVINWVHRDGKIVSGPCSALAGPVDEFQVPLGWDEAKEGGTFLKLGVGVLRKTGEKYNRFFPYEVVNSGKWTVKKRKDSVEFTQVLNDPELGYGYIYQKVVRLVKDKPQMVIERSLKNTGRLQLKSEVYDHNFVVLDKQPPGPDFTIKFPFQIETPRPLNKELVSVRGNEIVYAKQLSGEDQAVVYTEGFSRTDPKDAEIVIENRKVGAGMKISGDRPIIRNFLWSVRSVLAVEAYVGIDIQPGSEFTWSNTYDHYSLPAVP